MKHGKRPTLNQRKLISSMGLNPENWLITKNTPDRLELVHRYNESTTRVIRKSEPVS